MTPAEHPPGRHLVLVGPTASGKSAVAVALAELRASAGRPTEIVSCDSMAVYRGMDIGTATPTEAERGGVPHHLLNVIDPSDEFSVKEFVGLVDDALGDIASRGASAVLVGGTGLYVQAVVDRFDLPGRYPEVAAQLELLGTEELAARLEALDPLAASRVPPGNRRRLVRALEVTIGSGRPFSASGPGMDAYPPTPFVLTGLTVSRDDLGPRIAERYRRQMDAGFLDEVAALDAGAGWSRTAREALGYRELAAHLRGECTLDEAIDTAVTRTRRFAVRQQRWFGRDPRIRWFDAPRPGAGDGADGDGASVQRCAEDLLGYWSQVAAAGSGPAATVDPSCCD